MDYKEMYEMAGRYLERIKNVDRDPIEYKDDLQAYFVFCYHIKDYLKKVIGNCVEDYVTAENDLSVCCNLSNRIKHKEYTGKRQATGGEFTTSTHTIMGTQVIHVHTGCVDKMLSDIPVKDDENAESDKQGGNTPRSASSVTVRTSQIYWVEAADGTTYDALILAEQCYSLWTSYMKSNKLL